MRNGISVCIKTRKSFNAEDYKSKNKEDEHQRRGENPEVGEHGLKSKVRNLNLPCILGIN